MESRVAPKEWCLVKLGDLSSGFRPAVKAGPFGSSLKKQFYVKAGYKVYGQEQVIRNDPFYGDYFIDENKFTELQSCAVISGDILISLVGTLGKILLIPDDAPNGVINPRLIRISVDINKVLPLYLKYYLEDIRTQNLLLKLSQGGTMGVLNANIFKALPFMLPTLFEQTKIAKILSTWDKAIDTTEKLIENSKTQKKSLMQQLLTGNKNFQNIHGVKWVDVKFNQLLNCKKRKGKIVQTNDVRNGLPYIGSTSFKGSYKLFTTSPDAIFCEPDDILILWDGENAGKVTTGLKGVVSSTVVKCQINKAKADSKYLAYCLLKDNYKIRAIREGSGIPHMPGDFEHWYSIHLPPLELQKKISSVLGTLDQEIDNLIKTHKFLNQEKKALMQQLLTGKRRVKLETIDHFRDARKMVDSKENN